MTLIEIAEARHSGVRLMEQRQRRSSGRIAPRTPVVLALEAEETLAGLLEVALSYAGFTVEIARDFTTALGSQDIQPVPSAYDNVLGQTRVDRGAALQQALVAFGAQSQFTVFPGLGHMVSDAMVSSSSAFLAAATGGS